MVSQMCKRAIQASHFMLQMIQTPLYVKETQPESENGSTEMPQVIDSCVEVLCDCGEEGLALRIAKVVGNHLLFVIGLSFTNPSYDAALEPTVPVFTFLFSVIMGSVSLLLFPIYFSNLIACPVIGAGVLVYLELPRCILDTSDPSKHGSKPDDSLAIVWRDEGFDDTDLNHITLKQLRQLVNAVIIYLAIVLAGCGVVSIADSFAPKEIATCLHISKAKGTFTQISYLEVAENSLCTGKKLLAL
ncbi:hypothetical protein S83_050114 [Arachis hypogaea]